MRNRLQLAELAARLRSESGAAQWEAMAGTDRLVGELMRQLPPLAELSGEEHAGLKELQAAHSFAHEACQAAHAEAASRLQNLCERREGWNAYALTSELQESAS